MVLLSIVVLVTSSLFDLDIAVYKSSGGGWGGVSVFV